MIRRVSLPCGTTSTFTYEIVVMCVCVRGRLCVSTQVQHLGGNTLSILLAVATVAMALLLWNSGALFSGAGGTAGQRKLRSTEYTD